MTTINEKTGYEKFLDYSYRYLAWIFIVLALLLVLLSMSEIISNPKINTLLEKIGIALFSSGVFAAVLKSLQFTGIFREEIEKVILSTDFVKNRRDLPQLWSSISKAIYNEKFPIISEEIEARILKTYLPTEYDYYYKDYIITIKVEQVTDNFEIIYTQTRKYDVVFDPNVEKSKLLAYVAINERDQTATAENTIEYFKINGVEVDLVEDSSTVDDKFKTKYVIPIERKEKPLHVETRTKRRYSLNYENCKLLRFATFTKNMDVTVSFPDDVRVSFFNLGNTKPFDVHHEEIPNQLSRSHKNDVLLPHQGFGMSFEKLKVNK